MTALTELKFRNTREAAAYLAGIIDGEGTVAKADLKSKARHITIVNTERALMDAVLEACAMLNIHPGNMRLRTPRKGGHKPWYIVSIYNRRSIQIVADEVPLRDPGKRQRVLDLLDSYEEQHRKWAEVPIVSIREQYEQGASLSDIAREYSVTISTVHRWLAKGGVRRRRVGVVKDAAGYEIRPR